MENIKQQMEEVRQLGEELKESFIKSIEVVNDKLNKLEQQVNKPKIEVGKWYKVNDCDYLCGLWFEKEYRDTCLNSSYSFGFGNYSGDFYELAWRCKKKKLADEKEVLAALTKHADKIYEGVEKVDRSCIDISLDPIVKFRPYQDSSFDEDGFMYKGRYVMNSSGVWAKPCVSLKKMTIEDIEKELGYKFELIK